MAKPAHHAEAGRMIFWKDALCRHRRGNGNFKSLREADEFRRRLRMNATASRENGDLAVSPDAPPEFAATTNVHKARLIQNTRQLRPIPLDFSPLNVRRYGQMYRAAARVAQHVAQEPRHMMIGQGWLRQMQLQRRNRSGDVHAPHSGGTRVLK